MNNKVLITGALGFIGKHIAKYFKSNGKYVIGIGHGHADSNTLTQFGIDEWYNSDITLENLSRISNPSLIVHCAGGSTVAKSILDPYLDYHKTVNSTLCVLEYIRINSPESSLIYLSSAAVYGSQSDSVIYEDIFLNPASPYGYHKLASENLCRSYSNIFGLNIAIIRFFSIYGDGLQKQLLWEASNKISKSTSEVSFFGTGYETRDWLHVLDAVKLVWNIANSDFKFIVLNGASGHKVFVKDILDMLLLEFNKPDLKIVFNMQNKSGDPLFYHADVTKAYSFGWSPEVELMVGIKKYVQWYKTAF